MRLPPPRSTRTATLFPYTTLFRSLLAGASAHAWRRQSNRRACGTDDPGGAMSLQAVFAEIHPDWYHRASADGHEAEPFDDALLRQRSEEHTSELQSLMRISYADFCLEKKKKNRHYKERTI